MTTKERQIEILEYKIENLENRIIKFGEQNFPEKKILKLEAKKAMYESQLAALLV